MSRTQSDVQVAIGVETQAAPQASSPRKYPYLPCGYESERRAEYVEWLRSAEMGGETLTPEYCEERFSVLLGVWAGFTQANPIDWWPAYGDLEAGDIAVLRLADAYVPDEVRNGRTYDVVEVRGENRIGVVAPTLPRNSYLDKLLASASTVLDPLMEMPDPGGELYSLPTHETFVEAATVTGLGPIGLGLVLGESQAVGDSDYFRVPIGMFLPFPVELLDGLLDPRLHEGEWFAGFSTVEQLDMGSPIRASITARSGTREFSYLSEGEFRRLVAWIAEEFDPGGWFKDEFGKLEAASDEVRAVDAPPSRQDPDSGESWNTWTLASPESDEEMQSLWGFGMLDPDIRDRQLYAASLLCSLPGASGEEVKWLRYATQRLAEQTSVAAREVAVRRLLLGRPAWAAGPSRDGKDSPGIFIPDRPILVSMAEHQLESLREILRAIEAGPERRVPIPERHGPGSRERQPGWTAEADDLALINLGWTRGVLAAFPEASPALLTIPVWGKVGKEFSAAWSAAWSFIAVSSESPVAEEHLDNVNAEIFDQAYGFSSDFRATVGLEAPAIEATFWNNEEHSRVETRLVPVEVREALACWEASHRYGVDGTYVIFESLFSPDPELTPDWFDYVASRAEFRYLNGNKADILALASGLGPSEVAGELSGLLRRAESLFSNG